MNAPTTDPAAPPTPPFVYEFHPLANIFPMLESKQLVELANDIEQRGLIEPMTLYEGKILDGRNRYEAAKLVKFKFTEQCFRPLPEGMDPKAFVISANIHRRHLTAEQKRDLIAQLIKSGPMKSDRQIAETAKVDHKTVGRLRKEGEATGEIPQLAATTGKDGKTRKARKKKVVVIGAAVADDPPEHSMKKFKAFLECVEAALHKWPKDVEQATEWHDYAVEKLDGVMDESWTEKESDEEVGEAA